MPKTKIALDEGGSTNNKSSIQEVTKIQRQSLEENVMSDFERPESRIL